MKAVVQRFLRYIAIETTSDEDSGQHPSTLGQMKLANILAEELEALKLLNIRVFPQGVVFAELPATAGLEHCPPLGFIAHLDTSNAAAGKNIKPQIIDYSGGDIVLPGSKAVLTEEQYPFLRNLHRHTLITTDGTTLLGADDKAGIAEIMTMLANIQSQAVPHGKICVAFTPDEEIGEGTMFFNVKDFGAEFAYTVDGGAAGEIEYQNFNAASAVIEITGQSVHPGSAKDIMINAGKLLIEFNAMLPLEEAPEYTENWQGFYHLYQLSGTVSNASASYLLRDHDAKMFAVRKKTLKNAVATLKKRYPKAKIKLTIKEQYRNMAEIIEQYPFMVSKAQQAVKAAGQEPKIVPIRGGTDGAMLSYLGLPCPNLGTGGYNFHGECELASINEMEKTVEILLNLIKQYTI